MGFLGFKNEENLKIFQSSNNYTNLLMKNFSGYYERVQNN